MKMLRKSISALLVLTMILAMGTIAFADFTDTKAHWANNEIDYLAGKIILNGYPDGSFKPQNNVTRVEIYKIINKVMGYTQESEVNFQDVQKSSWYYPEVAKGLKAGYISPSLDGKLNPNIPATRQEVATIIGIAFGLPKDKSDSAKIFVDADAIALGPKGI